MLINWIPLATSCNVLATYLLQVSRPEHPQLAKPDMERGGLESAISLSHHNHINGPRQIGGIHIIVQVFTGRYQPSSSPADFAQVVRHLAEY